MIQSGSDFNDVGKNASVKSRRNVIALRDSWTVNGDLKTEPHFYLSDNRSLYLDMQLVDSSWLNYLNYQIRRTPCQLQNHVRKIFILSHSEPDHCFPALLDLFRVLKGGGRNLKLRMLKLVKKSISTEEYQFLIAYVVREIPEDQGLHEECLIQGSNRRDVINHQEADIKSEDLMEIIETYIENCQLDLAMDTLEQGLLDDPDNNRFCALLTDLYQATKEFERIDLFVKKLPESHRESWRHIQGSE